MTLPITVPAAAQGFRDVVVHPAHRAASVVKPRPTMFTAVSHLIYMNNCMPSGCTVYPGFDDSLTQHSSIPQSQAYLAPWGWGAQAWKDLVVCVQGMYHDFNVQITDIDPGPNVPHFELMVGGNSTDVGVDGAGGVAPFIPCGGELEDNVISFVFAASISNPDFLCWASAQETAHVFGLDHEMNAKDPMTYLSPPTKKEGFQNTPTACGEYQDRMCYCGQATQDSYQYLMDTFGPSSPVAPKMAIDSPADGAWVKPGFVVRATATSQLSITASALVIDGTAQPGGLPPLVFTSPAELTAGDHTITVSATDHSGASFSSTITVHVVASCAGGGSCHNDFQCLGGYCLPTADEPGGLGAHCTDNGACITGTCATDGTSQLCSGPCDPGNSCPSGFACETGTSDDTSFCWPSTSSKSGGGCASGGGGAPGPIALGALGALLALVRKRRRR
jgi:MYXO-CTERM domain-containing protein